MFILFIYYTCPFCIKVLNVLTELQLKEGKEFSLIDASTTQGGEKLIQIGGKKQVPFLVDGTVKMYESSEIISYIKQKLSS